MTTTPTTFHGSTPRSASTTYAFAGTPYGTAPRTSPFNPRTRTLHLIDIENLLGNPDASALEAEDVLDRYLESAAWQPGDLVTIAANAHLATRFMFRPPVECSLHSANGPDGADLMLLAHAAPSSSPAGPAPGHRQRRPRLHRSAIQTRALGVGVVVVAKSGSVHRGGTASRS